MIPAIAVKYRLYADCNRIAWPDICLPIIMMLGQAMGLLSQHSLQFVANTVIIKIFSLK